MTFRILQEVIFGLVVHGNKKDRANLTLPHSLKIE